ncbi:flagellar hook-associated protein FlgL [Desertibacillus haloalkaliphilus]|uniref:flagellar hook-associated protein FlgL n=1 Tax=Desertibacillus haloalkaliphilus TaxID=1328930 RepID=UPI001FE6474F|nr:flagellar hook-associated protein FlgL [Desertibacillus haloalkaliphilus]
MRVTQTMLTNNTLRHISQGYDNLGRIQDQLTSGKKITRASQDPVIAMNGMRHRTEVAEITQFKRNVNESYQWLNQADSALDEVTQALQRIRELTVQAANDTYDKSQRANIAKEIIQLNDHIASIGNTQVNGRYIFNGTNTQTPPVDLTKLNNFRNMPTEVSERSVEQVIDNVGNPFGLDGSTIEYDNQTFIADLSGFDVAAGDEITISFPETNELPEATFTAIVDENGQIELSGEEVNQYFNYYYENNGELEDVILELPGGDTIPFIGDGTVDDAGGELRREAPINVSFPADQIAANLSDDINLDTDRDTVYLQTDHGKIKLDLVDGNYVASIDDNFEDYRDGGLIDQAEILVEKPQFNFEFKAEVDTDKNVDLNNYYVTAEINGREHRFIYVGDADGNGVFKNERPIYSNLSLEQLEEKISKPSIGNEKEDLVAVQLKPDASPTSTNIDEVNMELLKGVSMSANIKPQNAFSSSFFADLQEMVEEISDLGDDLEDGEAHEILSGYLGRLDGHIDSVVAERAELGARTNRIELMEWRIMQQEVTAKRILSENEDADMEQVIIDLTTQESVHRAALSAGARIIQPTLMDFLR